MRIKVGNLQMDSSAFSGSPVPTRVFCFAIFQGSSREEGLGLLAKSQGTPAPWVSNKKLRRASPGKSAMSLSILA